MIVTTEAVSCDAQLDELLQRTTSHFVSYWELTKLSKGGDQNRFSAPTHFPLLLPVFLDELLHNETRTANESRIGEPFYYFAPFFKPTFG